MKKELPGLEEGLKTDIHMDSHRTKLKKCRIEKYQAMMAYLISCLKTLTPSTIDWLLPKSKNTLMVD